MNTDTNNNQCISCINGGKHQSKKRNRNYKPKNTKRFYKQLHNSRKRGIRKSNKRRVKRIIKGGGMVTYQSIQPYSPTNLIGITPNSVFI